MTSTHSDAAKQSRNPAWQAILGSHMVRISPVIDEDSIEPPVDNVIEWQYQTLADHLKSTENAS